jgi:hypothetical protein
MKYENYFLAIIVLAVIGYFGSETVKNYIHSNEKKTNSESVIIKQYLLNDSPLHGKNRPKLWIHSKYEYNSRKWKSFYSRSSYDLNQPYLHLTIKSLINHCGDDFDVCLIDDDTFSKLIPHWDAELSKICEPMKSHLREIGIAELLFHYGGLVVPNSFVCCKNLMPLYQDGVGANGMGNQFFVSERPNKYEEFIHTSRRKFMPDHYIMGARKNNLKVKEYVDFLKKYYGCPDYRLQVALPDIKGAPKELGFDGQDPTKRGPFYGSDRNAEQASGLPDLDGPRMNEAVQTVYTWESELTGDIGNWLLEKVESKEIGLVDGKYIGVKSKNGKPIDLDELLADGFLDVDNSDLFGIYIDADDLLIRPKYAWFAVLPAYQVLNTHTIVAKYLKLSIIDSADIYRDGKKEQKSVVSL